MPGPMSKPHGGKTRRDYLSGKHSNHLSNQVKRADWNRKYIQSSKNGPPPIIPYPVIGDGTRARSSRV